MKWKIYKKEEIESECHAGNTDTLCTVCTN